MNPAGLLLALLDLLLPGYSWILISGLSKRLGSFERLALSFMLSICSLSLLTGALSLFTSNYITYSGLALFVTPALLIVVRFIRNPTRIRASVRLNIGSSSSLVISVTLAAVSCILLMLFWSAPYYPTAYAFDPIFHIRATQAIVAGEGKKLLLQGNVPVGLQFASATIASLAQITALDSLRILLSLVLLVIIPLSYISARELFRNKRTALVTVLVASFVFPVEAIHFIMVGTFPNLLEDAIILTIAWLLFAYVAKPNPALGVTLGFLGIAGIFTHSSFLLFLGVLWILAPLIVLRFRGKPRRYLQACGYSTGGAVLLGVILWSFFRGNIERVLGSYVLVTHLGSYIEFSVVFENLAHNFVLFAGPLGVVAIALAVMLVLVKQRDAIGPVFTTGWLIVLVVFSFFSGFTDRFVLFSLVPATFLVGNLIASFLELSTLNRKKWPPILRIKNVGRIIVPLFLLLLALTGSFPGLMFQAFNPAGRAHQQAVIDSMQWLQQNKCSNGIASVGLSPDYRYLETLTGLTYMGDFYANSTSVLQESTTTPFRCVAVAIDSPFFESFEQNPQFQERYRNSLLVVFIL